MSKLIKNSGAEDLFRVYTEGDPESKQGRVPDVGDRLIFSDGREFIFCSSKVDLGIHKNVGFNGSGLEVVDPYVKSGMNRVCGVLAGVSKDQYSEGVVFIESSGGVSQHGISSNTSSATVDGVADSVILELTSSVEGTPLGVYANMAPANDVIVGTATNVPVGCTMVEVTAGTVGKTQYFWAQITGLGLIDVGVLISSGNTPLSPAAASSFVESDGSTVTVASYVSSLGGFTKVVFDYPGV